ncbi:MAG TPA: hypothetical protein VNK94_05490, partial [Gaiellaceae bacterium]|nr:hypothetical protein [Gaiellaceae bacterium]
EVFAVPAGTTATLRTAEGSYRLRALGPPVELAGAPAEQARRAIVSELQRQRRAEAWAAWTLRAQQAAESRLVCERDRLPEPGVVTLASFALFLSLSEVEADRWAAARRR